MNIGFFKNVLDKVSFSKPQRIFHQSKLEFFLYSRRTLVLLPLPFVRTVKSLDKTMRYSKILRFKKWSSFESNFN